MAINPFASDGTERARFMRDEAAFGADLRARAFQYLAPGAAFLNRGHVISGADTEQLVRQFSLASTDQLMVHLIALAQKRSDPSISGFPVGAVGLEAETGALVLGSNMEFPGSSLSMTMHGEGFVATRAFSRGQRLVRIAISEAHPCAHCRQYLCEFDWRDNLELIDPLGHRLKLADLYPWPFDPAYLGEHGARPGRRGARPAVQPGTKESGALEALIDAGARGHMPYSGAPAAVVIETHDGALIRGVGIESVAFNPTIMPIQAALVDLVAHGYSYVDIDHVHVGFDPNGPVDHRAATQLMVEALAPGAKTSIVAWSSGNGRTRENGDANA